jgi:low temperature requirement protein LtrA
MALLFRGERMGQNYAQLSVWNVLSGLFWIAGVLLPDYRLALWGCAVLVDYGGPYAGFWVPGLGMTPMETWPLRGLHLMERNELVFIIALGESILLLGGTLVSHPITAPTLLAAAIGFFMIVVLWWLYFAHAPSEGERAFHNADAHTRRARGGLAYANGVMVCGAVVMAVSIEMVLAHPLDAVHAQTVLVAVAGPVIFLVGGAMFHRSMAERIPLPGLVTMPILAAFGYAALVLHLSGLWLGAGVLAILIALARFSPRRTDPET